MAHEIVFDLYVRQTMRKRPVTSELVCAISACVSVGGWVDVDACTIATSPVQIHAAHP